MYEFLLAAGSIIITVLLGLGVLNAISMIFGDDEDDFDEEEYRRKREITEIKKQPEIFKNFCTIWNSPTIKRNCADNCKYFTVCGRFTELKYTAAATDPRLDWALNHPKYLSDDTLHNIGMTNSGISQYHEFSNIINIEGNEEEMKSNDEEKGLFGYVGTSVKGAIMLAVSAFFLKKFIGYVKELGLLEKLDIDDILGNVGLQRKKGE